MVSHDCDCLHIMMMRMVSNMILTIGQICVLSANLAPESYCDFLLDVDRRQFVAVALEQSCEK